ncbi:MAG: peptide chain release factor N(5)-glutamine methyltransferase [Alphaproteobacteria bacterium]|nr:peptide chain release factor N(5)-glutamine methyltransferase [Alphaproteobacteria bacterium]
MSLVEILTRTEAFLRERGIDGPRRESELLLSHVLGLERLQLYLSWDRPVTEAERATLRELVARRGRREPLAWILGTTGFHALDLLVHRDVLVPRPDSETLVDAALEWIPKDASPVYVADIGSGTGAIGLAIAMAHPGVRLYATDVSEAALANTRANVAALGLTERVAVLAGPFLEPIPSKRPVEWVVSNPPYIPRKAIDGLMPEVARFEPRLALDGGPDGLDVYRALIPLAAARATRGVLVEIGQGQAPRVLDLMRKAGLDPVQSWNDLAGIPRVVGGLVPDPSRLVVPRTDKECP